jgi:hypothetical protein
MYLHLHALKRFNTYKSTQLDKNRILFFRLKFSRGGLNNHDERKIIVINT